MVNLKLEDYSPAIKYGASIDADLEFRTDDKLTFRDSGIYLQSPSDGKFKISADAGGDDDITLDGGVTISSGNNLVVTKADGLTVNSVIVPQTIPVVYGPQLNANLNDEAFFIADKAYEVVAIQEVHSTAESAGTVGIDVERLQSTEAPGGNGDSLTSAAADGTSTKDTVQDLTVVSDDTQQLSAGDRLGINYTGDAPGELDGVVVLVQLKRI